jgi:hypothetical protein
MSMYKARGVLVEAADGDEGDVGDHARTQRPTVTEAVDVPRGYWQAGHGAGKCSPNLRSRA